MSPSRALYACSLAFIAGIALRSFGGADTGIFLVFLFACLAVLAYAFARRKDLLVSSLLLLLCFWVGVLAADRAFDRAFFNELKRRELLGKEVLLRGVVSEDPDARSAVQKITMRPLGLKEKVLVNVPVFPSYEYGDLLTVRGRLQEPPIFEDFNYKEFLEKEGIFAIVQNPRVEEQARANLNILQKGYALILNAKRGFQKLIARFVPHPESTVLSALLFGDQGAIPESLKDRFNKTGTRHLVAVSGQHVALLFPMLMAFFLSLGLWRRQALVLSNVFLALFIMFTGFSASAVRAGIMGSLMIASQLFGRMNVSMRGLVFAASLMLLFNPLLLARDVGFQLSFAALLGIIWFFPFFQRMFRSLPNTLALRDAVAMTLAAQITTLPLVAWSFHYVSLSSLFTNILLAPVMSPALLGGFLFLFIAGVSAWGGALFAMIPAALVKYVLLVVSLFSEIPFSSLTVPSVPVIFLFAYGTLVGLFAWLVRKKQFEMIY